MELADENVREAVRETGSVSFKIVQEYLTVNMLNRKLTRLERLVLSKNLIDLQNQNCANRGSNSKTNEPVASSTPKPHEILVCMAYSKDYTIGNLCELVNREYASYHGYGFISVVMPYDDMMSIIHPRSHCAWFKAIFVSKLLQLCLGSESSSPPFSPYFEIPTPCDGSVPANFEQYQYIMWIDADAVVLNPSITLQSYLERGVFDLWIGEDLGANSNGSSSCCPINSGVFLVRVTEWSLSLWTEVWAGKAARRYHKVRYHEQSTLVKCLRNIGIDLEDRLAARIAREKNDPIFRAQTAHNAEDHCDLNRDPIRRVYCPHVCVLKQLSWNSNQIPVCTNNNQFAGGTFIFHAVGSWNKGEVILAVIKEAMHNLKDSSPNKNMKAFQAKILEKVYKYDFRDFLLSRRQTSTDAPETNK